MSALALTALIVFALSAGQLLALVADWLERQQRRRSLRWRERIAKREGERWG